MARFENPWANPVGEALCTILSGLLRFRPLYDSPSPPPPNDEPEPPFQSLKLCVGDCNKVTLHREYFWRVENETTVECGECLGVWVVG